MALILQGAIQELQSVCNSNIKCLALKMCNGIIIYVAKHLYIALLSIQ